MFEQPGLLLALLATSEAIMWLCQVSIPSKFSGLGNFWSLRLLKFAYVVKLHGSIVHVFSSLMSLTRIVSIQLVSKSRRLI